MSLPRFVARMFPVAMIALGASVVAAQDYPDKTIRILTSRPGGSADIVARVIAKAVSGSLGKQVIVDNRGGLIAIETVAKAPPDGYSLLLYGSAIWLTSFMRDNVSWDPLKDFSPITIPENSPNVLVVHPSLPVKSVKDLIALARARPGALNYAATTGASSHVAGELFKAMAGVNILQIGYKGTGPALNDLAGGQVELMFAAAAAVMAQVKSGRLKALAVASARPSALAPGLPTVAAYLPGYESVSVHGIFAPAGTPATIIRQLHQEIVRALGTQDVKERLLKLGLETIGSSPEQLTAMMKSEMARLGKVIKDAGIRAE